MRFDRWSRPRQLTFVEDLLSADRGDVPLSRSTSFEDLFEGHVDVVFRMVRRLLGPGASEADVDDVVQQVFIAAHRSLPGFRGDAKVTTWLYGIALRTVLAHLRSWRRHRAMLTRLQTLPTSPYVDDLHQQTERKERLHTAWRALMNISPKKRIALLLFEVEGYSAPEIATMLNVREGTVRSRLRHARQELAAQLQEVADEP